MPVGKNQDAMVGERTCSREKGDGVKQGCHISPRLFIIALNHALLSAYQACSLLLLNVGNVHDLPLVIAYADDLLVFFEEESQTEGPLHTMQDAVGQFRTEIELRQIKHSEQGLKQPGDRRHSIRNKKHSHAKGT